MSHGLLLWLENIDRRRNEVVPIDPIQDSDTLHEHHKILTVPDQLLNPRGPNVLAPTHFDVHLCSTVTSRYFGLSEKFKRHLKEKTLLS